jgi:hypothetical protein
MRAARAAEHGVRPAIRWRAAAAFAMAVCLVLVVQVALVQHARQQQRIDALRAEQHQIEADLAVVKQQASESQPVVVLEHADGTRVVVDQTPSDPAIVPASYTFN